VSDPLTLSKSYFLSYSRADETFALRFATDLRERGIAMWVDQLDIRPSEHWDRAIERAVHECRGLLVILSPRSVESDNVADEISFAIDHGKPVLPVMIEKCRLPLRITRMQVIDATGNYERALGQALDVLSGGDLAAARRADEQPARAGIQDAEVIAAAKARLTDIQGPISGILVDRAAARASSVGELYRLLGEQIECEKDRERFLKSTNRALEPEAVKTAPTSAVASSPVPQAEVDRLGSLLTLYLGPISAAVARRESATAASPDGLLQRLASLIPNETERAEFLRQAQAH
jgi:hypothetical protein